MIALIESNWFAFTLVAVLAVLVALWLLFRSRKPEERSYRPDVLDEGVAPAARNQALIDAPPAAERDDGDRDFAAAEPMKEEAYAGGETNAVNEPEVAGGSAAVASAKIADATGTADDLSRIKGLGPKLVAMLGDMGISRFDQIAAWSDEDVARIDAQLGKFSGRIERDDWRSQARYLADGDTAGYEARFGKL